jgi:glycosyltransferase involved in cell wall biosynthesis
MPAYNAEQFIARAIESILSQDFKDFECIIIEDGSSDATKSIIARYTDPRIRLIANQNNIGLAHSLNAGIQAARGAFIARMDADDVSLPERLKVQVLFLENHPEIACIGSRARAIYADGRPSKILWRPTHEESTKFLSLFETPLLHPTVMGRASIMRKYLYNPSLARSEDYDLWSRMLADNLRITNIPHILLSYYVHAASFTRKAAGHATEVVSGITLNNMGRYQLLSSSERRAVEVYRRGGLMTFRQWATFSLLSLELVAAFIKKEGAYRRMFGLFRIAIFTSLRLLRRTPLFSL